MTLTIIGALWIYAINIQLILLLFQQLQSKVNGITSQYLSYFSDDRKRDFKKHTPKLLRQLINMTVQYDMHVLPLIVQIWQLTSIFTGVFIRGRVFTGSPSIDAQNRSMDYRSIKRGQSAGILSLCDDSDTRRPPSDSRRHKQPMVHAICFLHQTHGTARFA